MWILVVGLAVAEEPVTAAQAEIVDDGCLPHERALLDGAVGSFVVPLDVPVTFDGVPVDVVPLVPRAVPALVRLEPALARDLTFDGLPLTWVVDGVPRLTAADVVATSWRPWMLRR